MLRLMALVAIAAILLGGLLEVPKVVLWSYHTRRKLEAVREYALAESRIGSPLERRSDRSAWRVFERKATDHDWQAEAHQPSLIGIACILGMLAGLPILAYGVARRSWEWMMKVRNRAMLGPRTEINA